MKYTGITYRPPYEADSLLVQVTQGCSHKRCSYCTMYRDVPFAVESMEQIEHDLREERRYYGAVERIFLLNGDAFVLGFDRLRAIAEKIIEIFPEVGSIGCYALFVCNHRGMLHCADAAHHRRVIQMHVKRDSALADEAGDTHTKIGREIHAECGTDGSGFRPLRLICAKLYQSVCHSEHLIFVFSIASNVFICNEIRPADHSRWGAFLCKYCAVSPRSRPSTLRRRRGHP